MFLQDAQSEYTNRFSNPVCQLKLEFLVYLFSHLKNVNKNWLISTQILPATTQVRLNNHPKGREPQIEKHCIKLCERFFSLRKRFSFKVRYLNELAAREYQLP